eukprot:m51a1_g3906 hypothetical protein (205) ;mRNA; r:129057-129941
MAAEQTKRAVRVLGVHCSPARDGNSAALLSSALEGAREAGATVKEISLSALSYAPCDYCAACHRSGGSCVRKDDMQLIYKEILEADVIIHATPIFFFHMPAHAKSYLDRWTAFYTAEWGWRADLADQMKQKTVAVMCVCGDTDHETMCKPVVDTFKQLVKFGGMQWGGSLTVTGETKGAVAENKEALVGAHELGKNAVLHPTRL